MGFILTKIPRFFVISQNMSWIKDFEVNMFFHWENIEEENTDLARKVVTRQRKYFWYIIYKDRLGVFIFTFS